MAGPAIDEQIKLGKAVAGSRVDSQIRTGLAVRKGAPKPDIGSARDIQEDAAVGEIDRRLFRPARAASHAQRVREAGHRREVKGKLKQTPSGVFVGTLIASGNDQISLISWISGLVLAAGYQRADNTPDGSLLELSLDLARRCPASRTR